MLSPGDTVNSAEKRVGRSSRPGALDVLSLWPLLAGNEVEEDIFAFVQHLESLADNR